MNRREGPGKARPERRRDEGHKARQWSAKKPHERAKEADQQRHIALNVLQAVHADDAYANLVLPELLRERKITGRDAGFTTELSYGTLRLQGRYDAILGRCTDRPLKEIDPPVLDILRLGCHQLLGMRIPAHAAVSETVALARQRTGAGSSTFVNAVLRQVGEHDLDYWLAEIGAVGGLEALAATQSHPLWIVRAFKEALIAHGAGTAEESGLETLLESDNTPAKVTLVARPGLLDATELVSYVPGELGRWATTAVTLNETSPGRFAPVRDGRAAVQDEGSQLVTLALAAVEIEGPDERWLDLCAGPGGKTALLASLAAERGARVVANEVSEHRTELVRQAVRAVPPSAVEAIVTADGREYGDEEPGSFDRVLVDAPCTGLGALRRRPESRWRRTPKDLANLTHLQTQLLTSAVNSVRVGGVVAYVTCSPHVAETLLVVDDVVRKHGGVERLNAPAVLDEVSKEPLGLPERDSAQLWPHLHGTDAMHLTLLRRTK